MTAIERLESPSAARMVIDGRPVLNFGGSCYLGLSAQPELVAAGVRAIEQLGSTGQLPRHYNFALAANLAAEDAARAFFGTEGAIYYATGYLFGPMAMTALAEDYDVAVIDESGHYNLVEGARMAQRPIATFAHRDAADLARVLDRVAAEGKRPVVATDGMFATFGTSPPLAEYQRLIDAHGGWLLVDESHSFGALGPTGQGACEMAGISGDKVLRGGSMAKAFCAYGGMTVGSADAIARLWQTPIARGAVSGMSAGAAMMAASLDYIRANPEVLERLRTNSARLRDMLRSCGLEVEDNSSPVAAFVHGDAAAMRVIQQALWAQGIFVIYSTYVGAGSEGALRIAAFADHEPEDFERLKAALEPLL
ncbi:MAG: aminotransferase class I/II-fold pyridoxal phosphate-dependent enzyme [Blastomonas sp.]|uniref:aminotransferase class I/II-fold pyridoxal phosphate-dependent enzyme n=1 Tax=Blastomonas sp. TaxID=1909299 RepID=UPI002582F1A3|nr:pyridoxal phosphate-dependent aminotransferase family protein [Blastomonas sp.]MCO5792563.1 aminotransferase class I/II-fold pyridoxal phosphate-dependent enzyme [Blastomonas sp.]